MYIPHIATVIHEQNIAIANGHGTAGAKPLNFEAMMVSNPLSVRSFHPLFGLRYSHRSSSISGSAFLLPLVPSAALLLHRLLQLHCVYLIVREAAVLSGGNPDGVHARHIGATSECYGCLCEITARTYRRAKSRECQCAGESLVSLTPPTYPLRRRADRDYSAMVLLRIACPNLYGRPTL